MTSTFTDIERAAITILTDDGATPDHGAFVAWVGRIANDPDSTERPDPAWRKEMQAQGATLGVRNREMADPLIRLGNAVIDYRIAARVEGDQKRTLTDVGVSVTTSLAAALASYVVAVHNAWAVELQSIEDNA